MNVSSTPVSASSGTETPESNYSTFVDLLATQLDQEGVTTIIELQKKSLARFEKTNEMLPNCSQLSKERLEQTRNELSKVSNIILDLKTDLEYIFRRIRLFKSVLSERHPDVVAALGKEEKEAT